jgi:hypothetical protein
MTPRCGSGCGRATSAGRGDRREHRSIVAFTVQEILDDEIARKLV